MKRLCHFELQNRKKVLLISQIHELTGSLAAVIQVQFADTVCLCLMIALKMLMLTMLTKKSGILAV